MQDKYDKDGGTSGQRWRPFNGGVDMEIKFLSAAKMKLPIEFL